MVRVSSYTLFTPTSTKVQEGRQECHLAASSLSPRAKGQGPLFCVHTFNLLQRRSLKLATVHLGYSHRMTRPDCSINDLIFSTAHVFTLHHRGFATPRQHDAGVVDRAGKVCSFCICSTIQGSVML